jgi:hypothetical protein
LNYGEPAFDNFYKYFSQEATNDYLPAAHLPIQHRPWISYSISLALVQFARSGELR